MSDVGSLLFQGFANLGGGIADGMNRRNARMEEQEKEEKLQARKFKALQELAETGYGIPKTKTTVMDLDSLSGLVQGKEVEQAIANAKLQRDVQQQQLTQMQQQALERHAFNQEIGALLQPQIQPDAPAGMIEAPGGMGMPGAPAPAALPPNLDQLLSAGARHNQLDPAILERIARMQAPPKGLALGAQVELPDGSVLTGLGEENTPNLRAPKEKPAPVEFTPPPGMVATGATMDDGGNLKFTFKPEAEGKALTQGETSAIASLSQAKMDLDNLETLFEKLGSDWAGPVSGRVKSMLSAGQNKNVRAIENAIIGATPNLARGVFREVGVLTDEDIRRYAALLPGPFDTDEVRKVKMNQLRKRLEEGQMEIMQSMKAAGRDVSGFESTAPKAQQQFDTEEAARSSGAKSGDIVLLYNPAKAAYQKFQLD